MQSMKHNSIRKYACPTHKHNANKKTNIKKQKQEQSFLINTKSSPPWYMHLPYGISLPYKCAREIEFFLPKNVHKNHIEMTKHSGILL